MSSYPTINQLRDERDAALSTLAARDKTTAELREAAKDALVQLDKGNWRDDLGHHARMNVAVIALRAALASSATEEPKQDEHDPTTTAITTEDAAIIRELSQLYGGAMREAVRLRAELADVNAALCRAVGVLMRPADDEPDQELLDARMACLKAQDALATTARREPCQTCGNYCHPRGSVSANATPPGVSSSCEDCGGFHAGECGPRHCRATDGPNIPHDEAGASVWLQSETWSTGGQGWPSRRSWWRAWSDRMSKRKQYKSKPCPGCGSVNLDFVRLRGDALVAIACFDCGARGPEARTGPPDMKPYHEALDNARSMALARAIAAAADAWDSLPRRKRAAQQPQPVVPDSIRESVIDPLAESLGGRRSG